MPALFNPHVFLPLLALVLIIANFVSYMIYRITHTVTGGQARLQVWGTPRDGKMTYLIAGTLNQPHTAFRAVLPELLDRKSVV